MTFPNRLVPRLCARGCVSGMCFIWIHLNYKNLQHDFSYPSKTNLVQNTRNIKEHFRGKIVTSTRTPGLCWPRDQKNNCEGHIHSVKDILSRRPHLKRFTNKNWLICSRRSCPLPTSIGYGLKILSESYELYWFLGWICTVSLKIGMLWIDRVSFQRAVFSSNFWMGLPRIKQIPQQIYLYIIVICISIYILSYVYIYMYANTPTSMASFIGILLKHRSSRVSTNLGAPLRVMSACEDNQDCVPPHSLSNSRIHCHAVGHPSNAANMLCFLIKHEVSTPEFAFCLDQLGSWITCLQMMQTGCHVAVPFFR